VPAHSVRVHAFVQPFPRQLHVCVRRCIVWLRVSIASSSKIENVEDGSGSRASHRDHRKKGGKSSENTYYGDGKVLRSFHFLLVRFSRSLAVDRLTKFFQEEASNTLHIVSFIQFNIKSISRPLAIV
jgi:hypothetical protein